jgi:hypothetical protein
VGELAVRDFHARVKDLKAGKGYCISAGTFSDEARRFVEARLIDLIEKQNLMMMMQNLRQHYQQAVGMLQMIENPMTPPDIRTYMAEALQGLNTLMRWAIRNFGVSEGGQDVVPKTEKFVAKTQQQQKQKQLAQQVAQPVPINQGQTQPPQPAQPPVPTQEIPQ